MGKFNFEAFQKEQQEKELRFGGFRPSVINNGANGNGGKAEVIPLLSISKNGFNFNKVAGMSIVNFGKYVEILLENEYLAMRFINEPSEYSFSLTYGGKNNSGNVQLNSKNVIEHIRNNAEMLNIEGFRYRFRLEQDGKSDVFYVNLSTPYYKAKYKGRV